MDKNAIPILTHRIDRLFRDLQKEVADYERALNHESTNRQRLRSLIFDSKIRIAEPTAFEMIATLIDGYEHTRRMNEQRLREIDSITGAIAGFLKIMLDLCLQEYSLHLKILIRQRIQRMADLRKIQLNSEPIYITFPNAVAILSPYLFLTKESNDTSNMVSVRNALNNLCESSY